MIYYKGTLEQFIGWERDCRIAEEIPLDGSGKIYQVNGKDAPANQRTVRYADCIKHPDSKITDVIWIPGKYPKAGKYPKKGFTELTYTDAISAGFITRTNE